jgi:hypothetical protein
MLFGLIIWSGANDEEENESPETGPIQINKTKKLVRDLDRPLILKGRFI